MLDPLFEAVRYENLPHVRIECALPVAVLSIHDNVYDPQARISLSFCLSVVSTSLD